jgi:hypothetical protein
MTSKPPASGPQPRKDPRSVSRWFSQRVLRGEEPAQDPRAGARPAWLSSPLRDTGAERIALLLKPHRSARSGLNVVGG